MNVFARDLKPGMSFYANKTSWFIISSVQCTGNSQFSMVTVIVTTATGYNLVTSKISNKVIIFNERDEIISAAATS